MFCRRTSAWLFHTPRHRIRNVTLRNVNRTRHALLSSTPIRGTTDANNDIVVGFIGLGNMGLPMASNLAKKERLLAFDSSEEAMDKLKADGAMMARSLEEVARESSIIVTMLPGCDALNSVMPPLVEASKEDGHCRLFLDCSTVSPTTSRYWNSVLQAEGHDMLDAPVSGGVKGAQDATLTFMVGSEEGTISLKTATHFLEQMGKRIIPCGGPGAGAATKLCNNLALATQMVGICEAMNLGEALGVDPTVLANVMNMSTAHCWASEVNNPHPKVASEKGSPASKDYQGGFGTKLMLKDLGLAVAAGQQMHVALPLATSTKELYQMAELRGLGDKDFGVILPFLRGDK